MKVFIMIALDEKDDRDLLVRVATAEHGLSRVYILPGDACRRNGNPYIVYRKVVESFTGLNNTHTDLNVFECTSGKLTD